MGQSAAGNGVLALVDDLLFASKIDGLARQHAVTCVKARTPSELESALATAAPGAVFVDLSLRGMDPIEAIARIGRETAWAGVPVVAYGSHVDTARLSAARAAGAGEVLARSEFTRRLPELVQRAGQSKS